VCWRLGNETIANLSQDGVAGVMAPAIALSGASVAMAGGKKAQVDPRGAYKQLGQD
jgi:hypothetical protein